MCSPFFLIKKYCSPEFLTLITIRKFIASIEVLLYRNGKINVIL